jgi:hypothetical protein
MTRWIVPVLVYVALGIAGLVIADDQTQVPSQPWWAFVFGAPLLGLPVVGFVLLAKPGRLRIGGVAIAAVIVGWFFAWREWWDLDCYDVGEIPGCGAPEAYLGFTWIASIAVCAIAIGVIIARVVRRHRRHRVSTSH